MTAMLTAALGLGTTYVLVGTAVAIVAVATRTLHLAVGQVLVAGVLVSLVAGSAALEIPAAAVVALALAVGAATSAALGPVVLDRLPSGLPWLLGLVVAAGTIDAVLVRVVTAATFRPRPLLEIGALGGIEPEVVSALVLGLPAVAGLAALLTRTRWGRRVRLVGGSVAAAARAGISAQRVRAQTLAVGGAAAVLAGLLAAPISFVGTGQAASFTVRGIAAAALLGRGGPLAAVGGGLLLAAAEVTGASLWPEAGAEVAVTTVVVGVLAIRGGEHVRAWGRTW